MNRRVLTLGVAIALAGAALTANAVVAQNETPPRPAHVHIGSCPAPGEVVQDLSFLTQVLPGVEHSSKEVAMAVSDMLATPHALVVHLSAEEIATYLVCGDIAGPPAENGDLLVTLEPVNDSGYAGIGILHDNGDGTTAIDLIMTGTGTPTGSPAPMESEAPMGSEAPAESPHEMESAAPA